MRKNFDLQSANFSSDSQEQIKFPPSYHFDMYNRQYSLVYNQAKQFFTECKQSINRFLSLNQYGLGFNIPMIWTTFLNMEYKSTDKNSVLLNNKRFSQWNNKKSKYEGQFHKALQKMNEVISDLIAIQIQIKSTYLNQKVVNLNKILNGQTIKKQIDQSIYNSKQQKSFSSKSIKQILINEQIEDQLHEEQQKMRRLLSEKIIRENKENFNENKNIVCHQNCKFQQNIDNLSSKMDRILKNITHYKQQQTTHFQIYETRKQIELGSNSQQIEKFDQTTTFQLPQSQKTTIKGIKNKLKNHKQIYAVYSQC